MMYGKLFVQMYDGTLGTKGPWQALITFQQLLILADQDGVVDMTAEAISRRTTVPLEIIQQGISELELPDPNSRTPDEEGKRITRLSADRDWGWHIVNYAKYRDIRSAEERRAYHRAYWHKRKAQHTQHTQHTQPKSTKVEVDTEVDAKALKSKPLARSQFNTGEVVERIPMIGGEEFEVRDSFARELERLYPAVDVPATLKQMRGWCIGNPTKLKTPRGIRKFITGWCERDQNG